MRASLVSRELIADSIELVASAHQFDAVVAISGCDKTIPGTVMALARLNVPALMLYGGSIRPGRFKGQEVTIQQVFEAVGAHAAGRITDAELHELEEVASPGAGACGGQFTANTMAMAFEVLGISAGRFSMVPAEDGRKLEVAVQGGRTRDGRAAPRPAPERHHHQARARERDRRRRDERRLDQRRAAPARGRPRNGRARSTIDEFDAIAERTPLLCDLQPGGQLRRHRSLRGRRRAARAQAPERSGAAQRGRRSPSPAARSANTPPRRPRPTGQRVVRPLERAARSPTAASRSCAATSRPTAASSSSPATQRRGTAARRACSTARRPRWRRCSAREIGAGDVVVIRGEGPAGGPGCARCSRSRRRSSARGSASRSR